MPTYTTSAKVLVQLPSSPPSSVTDNLAEDIADASGIVEAMVGTSFPLSYEGSSQKFPDITSDPATPAIVALAATYLAASRQFQRLGESVGENGIPQSEQLHARAMAILDMIREGKIDVTLSDGTRLTVAGLDSVEDKIYADRTGPDKEIFNQDDMELHWP